MDREVQGEEMQKVEDLGDVGEWFLSKMGYVSPPPDVMKPLLTELNQTINEAWQGYE
jgi:hypothetical protein